MKKSVLLAFVSVVLSLTMFEVQFVVPLSTTGESSIEIWADYILDRDITFDYDGFIVRANNVVLDLNGHTITGSGWGTGVDLKLPGFLEGASNVTVKNGVIKNFTVGIGDHHGSENNSIANNTITDCAPSGVLSYGISSNIIGNTITNTTNGIACHNYSVVKNNYLVSSRIRTYGEENNIINNTLMDSYIELHGGGSNTLWSNRIANWLWKGIDIYQSNNNIIVGNNMTNNGCGIWLDSSTNTIIYHNNFINNTSQIHLDNSLVNTWDNGYPSGGNYWNDYNGTDFYSGPYQNETGSDGIGDAPYVIDADNQDNYPLMGMFYDFTVFVPPYPSGGFEHIIVISNSTVSNLELREWLSSPNEYLQPGQKFIWFEVTGEEVTIGFCRLMIPRVVLNSSYIVLVDWQEVPVTELLISNSTHAYLYFTHSHSTQEIVIVPEFPTWTSMLLLLIVFTVAIAIYKRRLLKTPIH